MWCSVLRRQHTLLVPAVRQPVLQNQAHNLVENGRIWTATALLLGRLVYLQMHIIQLM